MSVKQVLSEALGGIQGANQARGLHNFIQEIRLCSNPTQEQQRVDKELANIRNKFSSSSGLSSYNRKKYVWKLVYMFMLGYEIDFGHMEMISLISSTKYSEKNVGYIAVSLLLRSGDTMMTLVINSIRNDLNSHSSPAQTLALATVANLGGNDLCDALLPDVERLLVMKGTDPAVRKKAALCFLRFFRENPGNYVHSELAEKMARLLENKNLGVVTSVMSLLIGLASKSPANYEGLVPHVIHLLTRLVLHKACATDYLYYGTPSPWMHVKLLKFLQMFPPPADGSQREKLDEALERIITKTEISVSVNKSNADHCILFEAVNVIIHHGRDSNEELRSKAMTLLGRFIAVKEPNIRYLGLEVMSRLARLEGNDTAKKHQATVLMSLKDADISIRRRALDLLFVMADETNGTVIVEELVTYLGTSGSAIREEMVLKIAILAEKFTDDLNWYVDKMLEMIAVAGDFVAGAVWHRIIQIVTNHKDLQAYAAERLFATLQSPRAHETAVSIGGYILGEFGYFIAEQENMSGQGQFHVLHQHFMEVGPASKALLLSTYAKLANLYPECRELVTPVFERFSSSQNLELQQRSCEYLGLPEMGIDVMEEVLKEMPSFPEDRESGPEARLRRRLEEQELGAEEGLRVSAAVDGEEDRDSVEGGDDRGVPPAPRRDGGGGGAREADGGAEGQLVVREQVEVDDLLGIGGEDSYGQPSYQPQQQQQQQQQQYQQQDAGGYGNAGAVASSPAAALAAYYGGENTPAAPSAAPSAPTAASPNFLVGADAPSNSNGMGGGGDGALLALGDDGTCGNYNHVGGVSNNAAPYDAGYGDSGGTAGGQVSYGDQGGGGAAGVAPGGLLLDGLGGGVMGDGNNVGGGGGGGSGSSAGATYGGGGGDMVGLQQQQQQPQQQPYQQQPQQQPYQQQSQQQPYQQQQQPDAGGYGTTNNGVPYGDNSGGSGGVFPAEGYGGGGYGGGGVGGGDGGGAGVLGVPPEMREQAASWLKALMVSDKGILFEGGPIKIGVVHEYRSSQGRLTLFLYNLAGAPLTDFRVDMPAVPSLRSQIGQGPAALDVGGKAQQVLMCECLQPFADAPPMSVSFVLEGRPHSLDLALPLSVCSFIEPLQLVGEDFSRRWEMLGNASKEEVGEVWAEGPVTAERWAEVRGMVISAIKLGVSDGPDTSPSGSNPATTLRAAGTLRTGSLTPQGNKISLGAMLRLEVDPAQGIFRICVRAVHVTVAVGIRQMLSEQLDGSGGGGGSGAAGRLVGAGGVGA